MSLTQNTPRLYQLGKFEDLPVAAAANIFEGAAVGVGSGYARPLAAGDAFLGFAKYQANNAAGAAGDINVRVQKTGVIQLPVTGVTIASNARTKVYASDDGTFTTTAGGNSLIGNVSRFVSSGVALVFFKATE